MSASTADNYNEVSAKIAHYDNLVKDSQGDVWYSDRGFLTFAHKGEKYDGTGWNAFLCFQTMRWDPDGR